MKKTKNFNINKFIDSKYDTYNEKGKRYMQCMNSKSDSKYFKGRICNRYTAVSEETEAILCWECTSALVDAPKHTSAQKSGKPAGWKFMSVFVDKDGEVYHKGAHQPELKGTLPPTDIEALKKERAAKKKKLTKQEKDVLKSNLLKEYNKLKMEIKFAKTKGLVRKISSRISKIERQLKKL